ncbi:hypothetical protein MTO96_037348 [Rhipicephalus appendiculatus]
MRNTDATFTDLANKFARSASYLDIGQTYVQPRLNADVKHVKLRHQRRSIAARLNASTAKAKALAPPPASPPKGHRPRSRTRRSQSKSRGKSQDRSLEFLNNMPGTASKPSTTTTLGPIPKKNRAASVEGPESPPTKKPAPAGHTPPAKVLILDEPTAALDPETRRSIWSLVKELRGKSSILLSTHDMEEADVLGDRIIVMYNGSIICWGSPSFLKNACGVGYKLRIEKEQKVFKSSVVLAVVKKTVPQATIEEEKKNEVIIALNTMERTNFPALFQELEGESINLGIKSTGLTVATMQDAYIK